MGTFPQIGKEKTSFFSWKRCFGKAWTFFFKITFFLDLEIKKIFAESSLSVAMFGTSREHLGNILKGNIFWKVVYRKVVFVLKVYDLIITNVYLLANSNNWEINFREYSRNIPRMSVSKIFEEYPWNIVKLLKYL